VWPPRSASAAARRRPPPCRGHHEDGGIRDLNDQLYATKDGKFNPDYDKLFKEQNRTIDPAARKALVDQMQEILHRESPYIVTAYSNDLEAYNIDKWRGYAASPSKVGNVLFPPYGNAGS